MYRQRLTEALQQPRSDRHQYLDQREDVVALELLAAVQELELDHEREPDHLAAELLDEVDLGLRRAARGEQVVVDEDARSAGSIASACSSSASKPYSSAYLALTVLHGSLPGLRAATKPQLEPVGERRAEDEAARLGAEDEVRLARLGALRELLDRLVQRLRVGEQRHDVLEDDPALREVRDVADLRRQVHCGALSGDERAHEPRQKSSWESSCESRASASRSSSPAVAPLGVAGAERRRHDLLEQAGLALGAGPEAPQVARRDAVAGELHAGGDDVDVALADRGARRPRRAARAGRNSSRSRTNSRRGARAVAERRRGRPPARVRAGRRRARALAVRRASARRAPAGSRAAAGTRRAGAAGSSRAARRRPR